jgi:hypothetical protein
MHIYDEKLNDRVYNYNMIKTYLVQCVMYVVSRKR